MQARSSHPNDANDASVTRHIRLFRNGANQALRIPREFEFPTQDATISRLGDGLFIQPIKTDHPRGSAQALRSALESMKDWEPILEAFPDVDAGLLPLDDIVL